MSAWSDEINRLILELAELQSCAAIEFGKATDSCDAGKHEAAAARLGGEIAQKLHQLRMLEQSG